jgi:hypothetical protein
MPTYRIRAHWTGPDGADCSVADDTVAAEDACHALDFATPNPYMTGAFTNATITIEKLSDSDPVADPDE